MALFAVEYSYESIYLETTVVVQIAGRDLIEPDSLGHTSLKLDHYLSGKRFSPAIRSKCGSVVRTEQLSLIAMAAIARSVSGKRCR